MLTRGWLVAFIVAIVGGYAFSLIANGAAPGWYPPATDWHWDKPARVDGDKIALTFEAGTCDANRWVEVQEREATVTLTVHIREKAGNCLDVGTTASRTVTLDRPLGDRELIDGACLSGDEPLRGNCPKPVKQGWCGDARYAVDLAIAADGAVRLRARLSGADPGSAWTFRWTQKNYDETYVGTSRAMAGRTVGSTSAARWVPIRRTASTVARWRSSRRSGRPARSRVAGRCPGAPRPSRPAPHLRSA